MSGLAEILIDEGFSVSGSDAKRSSLTDHLEARGVKIYIGQREENISSQVQAVVYTAAVHEDNPEYKRAVEMGLPMLTRAQLLGQMMKNYRHSVAVAGTHGKTTTTSMITEILLAADEDPTISVGGILNSIGGNIRVGSSDLFVTEACEYTNSFLEFNPTIGVILNIEADHLDFFKDIEDIRHSFHLFAGRIPERGALILNRAVPRLSEITEGLTCRIVTFGKEEDCDFRAENIRFDQMARPSYDLVIRGEKVCSVSLGVPGEHNVYNSLAAAAACTELGISLLRIQEGLSKFTGTNRRFEKKGEVNGITIVDDYAHHPQEIQATLEAAKHYPHNKLWVVFQPHTYTRTKAFLDEFAQALSLADEVILADIYAARETDTLGISSKDIQDRIIKAGGKAHYFSTFDQIEEFILQKCIHGDLLITMGAGDIVKVGERLLGL